MEFIINFQNFKEKFFSVHNNSRFLNTIINIHLIIDLSLKLNKVKHSLYNTQL